MRERAQGLPHRQYGERNGERGGNSVPTQFQNFAFFESTAPFQVPPFAVSIYIILETFSKCNIKEVKKGEKS
jgi:hypothetical protein